MKKIAIIGLGHIASVYVEAFGYVSEGFKLVAVVDKDPATKTKIPSGVSFYSDVGEMLDRKEAEAVVVSVPQSEHYAVAKRCLESGLDVLLEKPATEVMSDFESLVEIANGCGRLIIFNAHAMFGLDVLWFKENAPTHPAIKALGGITGFRAGFYDPYIVNGQLTPSGRSLGGSWRDSGVNALSVLWMLGFSSLRMERNSFTKGLAPYKTRGMPAFPFEGMTGRPFRGR